MTLRKNASHARATHVDPHTPFNLTAPPAVTRDGAMTEEQRVTLKQLSQDAYEPDAFDLTLTQAEAAIRIRALTAKLALMSEPPHTA